MVPLQEAWCTVYAKAAIFRISLCLYESYFSPKLHFLVFLITQLSGFNGREKVLEYFDLFALFNSSLQLKSCVAMEMQHTWKGQNMFPDSVIETQ